MPLSQGEVLKQRYRIVKKLGEGGFGAVYRAWDINLKGPCAIKENFETSPEAQRQFLQEATLLFNLRHPNLPRVFDSFSLPGEGQYLVMDYIEGHDMQELLERQGGILDHDQVLPWIMDICDALEYLHGWQPPIIHRDLKPANIRITPEGTALLVDFGIAKMYDPFKRTTMGARAATPGFAPFEQYGQGQTDARTDVYALGATMYTTLTGVEPPESIARIKGTELIRPRIINQGFSRQLEAVILNSMALLPADRYQRISEMKAALDACPEVRTRKPITATMVVPSGQSASAAASLQAAGRGILPPLTSSTAVSKQMKSGYPRASQKQSGLPQPLLLSLGVGLVLVTVLCVFGIVYLSGNQGNGNTTSRPAIMVENTTIAQEGIPAAERTEVVTVEETASKAAQTSTPTHDPSETPAPEELEGEFTDDYGVRMALIPAGVFLMGSEGGFSNEEPLHKIWLEAFNIDIYEVTNDLFAQFLNEMGNQEEGGVTWLEATDEDARIHQSDGEWVADTDFGDHPLVEVSWFGARAYCEWRGARLPTEAEWEKAARGGLEGKNYPWGNPPPVCQKGVSNGAKFDDDSGCDKSKSDPVGSYNPNDYGLFDMAGNVWEWVADWYGEDYYGSSPYENPSGPDSGTHRVLRGGSWGYGSIYLRSANRTYDDPDNHSNVIGFRCVSEVIPGN